MEKIKYKFLFASSLFLFMCVTYNLSFTWLLPRTVMFAITAVLTLLFYSANLNCFKADKSMTYVVVFLCLVNFYLIFCSPNLLGSFIFQTIYALVGVVVVISPIALKKYLLNYFSLFTSLILFISLIGWLMYNMGVPLPSYHVSEFDDGYHVLNNYYFFIINVNTQFEFPRFASMFIEPGQMASPVLLLLLLNLILKGRKFDIIVQTISVILSFSLAAWIVGIIAIIIYVIIKNKAHALALVASLTVVIVGGSLIVNKLSEDSMVTQMIVNRLIYDKDTGIVGNNRTDYYFDYKYLKYINSEKAIFGISKELREGHDWTIGNSGYKLIIVNYGIIGFILFLLLAMSIFLANKSKYGAIVFFSYFILGAIRNFWGNIFWLYLIVCALPVIKYEMQYVEFKLTDKLLTP